MRQAWLAAVAGLGGELEAARAAADDLERRYAEPHRHYHTEHHVRAVLLDGADIADDLAVTGPDRDLLTVAICAHDVIYDAAPGADERASAAWVQTRLLASGVPAAYADRAAELVLTTIRHNGGVDDPVAAALSDADLAILGSSPREYRRYVRAVRAEYASVPDELWRSGRARVLGTFLDRDPFYVSDLALRRWRGPARENLTAELAELTARS
jgi:predicted metal-dependent HD superfamily phosphohydrolase